MWSFNANLTPATPGTLWNIVVLLLSKIFLCHITMHQFFFMHSWHIGYICISNHALTSQIISNLFHCLCLSCLCTFLAISQITSFVHLSSLCPSPPNLQAYKNLELAVDLSIHHRPVTYTLIRHPLQKFIVYHMHYGIFVGLLPPIKFQRPSGQTHFIINYYCWYYLTSNK